MNNHYNMNESNKDNLIEDLKKLPKVNAPDDFEFKLMTRIQNKNFGTVVETQPKFNIIKFLAPSAVVATAVLLLFIFYPRKKEFTNINISQSQTITNESPNSKKNDSSPKDLAFNTPVKNSDANVGARDINQNGTNTPSPIKSQHKLDALIHDQNSISLDDYISGSISNQRNLRRGSVVASEDDVPDFDGFFVKQKTDPATLKRYREVVDSLKKTQLKLDSLKKASKLP